MVRRYLRKTGNGSFTSEAMTDAVNMVINDGLSIRRAAEIKGLPFQTLSRYVKKMKTAEPGTVINMTPRYDNRNIFTNEQDSQLAEYLLTCSKMNFPLSTTDCRRLAYETAIKNNMTKLPDSWAASKLTGINWLQGFMQRNKHLSLRLPEARSLSRATSFNRFNINIFFEKLSDVMSRNEMFGNGSRVYNLDETGVTTVQTPRKVIGEKGAKQVYQITSLSKSIVATDTPEKNEIASRDALRKVPKRKLKPTKIFQVESEDSDEPEPIRLSSSESCLDETFSNLEEPQGFGELDREPTEGNFVLVQFCTKRSEIYYVGKLISDKSNDDDEFDISYLRMSEECQTFKYPEIPEIKAVALKDIKMILPQPTFYSQTKRQNSYFKFGVNFQCLNIKIN